MRAPVNGVELCVDTFGDPSHPAVLLIMGLAASMDRWEPPFCERLAAAGRHVVRYDHRDTGGSTTCPPGAPDYTGADLSRDALGVLDHLGIERAHLVGMSAGGGIAQDLAIGHPGRARTLTLLSTGPVADDPERPPLPGMSDELAAVFAGGDAAPEPDWSDRDAVIRHLLAAERPYTGARGRDEPAMRELLGRAHDRSIDPRSAGNHWIADGGPAPAAGSLRRLALPTLVIHGTHDPLFPLPHGEALAREIPGARLLVVPGLGHELPRWAWDAILPAVIEHTAAG